MLIFLDGTLERQKILDQMVASNPWVQPALNFFMNSVLICCTCSKIFELGHIFEGFIISLYVVILSCILFMTDTYIHTYMQTYVCTYIKHITDPKFSQSDNSMPNKSLYVNMYVCMYVYIYHIFHLYDYY